MQTITNGNNEQITNWNLVYHKVLQLNWALKG